MDLHQPLQAPVTVTNFYDLPNMGKNEWWRYLLSLLNLIFFYLGSSIFISLILFGITSFDNNPATTFDITTGGFTGLDPLFYFSILMISFVCMLVSILISVRFIHKRPFLSLVSQQLKFNWREFGASFTVYFLLAAAGSLTEALIYPGRYLFTFNPVKFFVFLPFILFFIPIQSCTEELIFRGYFLQSVGKLTRRFLIPPLITSLVFMLMHLANPEFSTGSLMVLAYYFLLGLFFSLVTLRENRLELSMGAHTANNLFAAVFANYTNSALTTPAIYTAQVLDPAYNLASLVVIIVVYTAFLLLRRKFAKTNA